MEQKKQQTIATDEKGRVGRRFLIHRVTRVQMQSNSVRVDSCSNADDEWREVRKRRRDLLEQTRMPAETNSSEAMLR